MDTKYKFKVLEPMSWRNKDLQPGDIIEDTQNSYMKAMIHQGKLERID